VTAYSLHPGVIGTDLTRHVANPAFTKLLWKLAPTKSIPQGAATSVFCAASPKAQPGEFHVDCNADLVGNHPRFRDADVAARLWTLSEQLVASKTAAATTTTTNATAT
jgi:hypothetical protein